jgi:hypothetical protein
MKKIKSLRVSEMSCPICKYTSVGCRLLNCEKKKIRICAHVGRTRNGFTRGEIGYCSREEDKNGVSRLLFTYFYFFYSHYTHELVQPSRNENQKGESVSGVHSYIYIYIYTSIFYYVSQGIENDILFYLF